MNRLFRLLVPETRRSTIRHLRFSFSLAIAVFLASAAVFPQIARSGGPENAIIVVNAESASSKLVANYYVHLRNIPPQNVVYLGDIPNTESISVADFRERILKPIIATIAKRGLHPHTDYIIYSSGFPTRVDATEDRKLLLESDDARLTQLATSKIYAAQLSLTSATWFYQSVLSGQPTWLQLNANTYMRNEAGPVLTRPFVGADGKLFKEAMQLARDGEQSSAIKKFKVLAKRHPQQLAVLYWLARTTAWQGEVDEAAGWLTRAVDAGWCYRSYTLEDPAFKEGIENKNLKAIIDGLPDLPFRHAPTIGFQNSRFWGPNGMVNSTANQGNRFVLSTMLAVNRNLGISERDTIDYLRRSVAADGTMPKGTFYFAKTSDVRSRTRVEEFAGAIQDLAKLGYRGEVVTGRLPKAKMDIAGLSVGTANFDWGNALGSTVLPGAICENLTSYGGRFDPGTSQTKLAEFLRLGAAGSSGTVVEPFAIAAKFPHPRIHVHYVRGCTLAESFYQSVAGPFQLIIIGDALCKPWALIPTLEVQGEIGAGQPLSGKLKIDLDLSGSPVPVKNTDLYLNGRLARRIEGAGKLGFEIDTETLPDGYHELRFVPVARGPIGSRGSTMIAFELDNFGQSTELTVESSRADINSEIEFEVTAEGASSVSLLHNERVLAKDESSKARFSIAAWEFGRGPVTVSAVAEFEGKPVRSRPVDLMIEGPISAKLPVLKAPPKK